MNLAEIRDRISAIQAEMSSLYWEEQEISTMGDSASLRVLEEKDSQLQQELENLEVLLSAEESANEQALLWEAEELRLSRH